MEERGRERKGERRNEGGDINGERIGERYNNTHILKGTFWHLKVYATLKARA